MSFQAVGSCQIDAFHAGNQNWNARLASQQFNVGKGAQSITITSVAPGNARVSESSYTVSATASPSNLPVAFALQSGVTACSLSGALVSFINVGACTIVFSQTGNANYNASVNAVQTFQVSKGPQTIAFTSSLPVGRVVAGPTYTPTAGNGNPSNLPPSFSIDATATTVCSISAGVVSFVRAGVCRVNLDQVSFIIIIFVCVFF